ncbi:hypothetical protein ISS03_01900 [Patescibacteria group bacterium]|nr:hypothetical protein [Patescibacteria group bacterium]
MTTKKIIFYTLIVAFLSPIVYFGAPIVAQKYTWYNVAQAASLFPWQDGGVITVVYPPCVLDTPANAPTTCAISCPLVTTAYASDCVKYTQIDVKGQKGTMFLAVPLGFVYRGGGTVPAPGMQFIAAGISNILPKVIGIPGP